MYKHLRQSVCSLLLALAFVLLPLSATAVSGATVTAQTARLSGSQVNGSNTTAVKAAKTAATVSKTLTVYYNGTMTDAQLVALLQPKYPGYTIKIVRTTSTTPAKPTTPTTPATPVQGLTQDEQTMFNLVNQERAKAGVAPLKIDLQLVKLARMKSQDMVDKGYFSHTSPTYGSPFDMMKAYGVSYSYAGENIAGASSVQAAHTNLMNSPSHRENILNPHYTRIGIGIISGSPYGKIFTQMFAG